MADPDFPAELNNIPYQKILGAPLTAAVEANTEASKAAKNFIEDVGFEQQQSFGSFSNAQKPVYVTFHYEKQTDDGSGGVTKEKFEMKVPLLLLLHIPYFEVDTVTVDLNVKLNSVEKRQTAEKGGVSANLSPIPLFSVSGSYKKSEKRSQTIRRTYDQSVHIEAGSIEPPEGVSRILGVLEQTITENTGGGGSSSNGGNSSNG